MTMRINRRAISIHVPVVVPLLRADGKAYR